MDFSYKVLWFFCHLASLTAEPSIKFATVIFRHGARTPVDPYPTDPYRNESLWPVRFGELTNEGKLQHYHLGQWLRRRYSSLLSSRFDPREISLHSTATDRTIMSALVNSAGIYPPKSQDIWEPNMPWQPTPIYTTPDVDEVLTMNKPCPNYHYELTQYKESLPYQRELHKYADLMEYLSMNTGKHVSSFDDVEYIYSTLYIEKQHNFTLPSWTRDVFPDKMKEPACYSFSIASATSDLARLKTGPLLKQITEQMTNWSKGLKSAKKVYVYSAHDTTVSNVLNSLGLFDIHCPPFTATVLIELLSDTSEGGYNVRVSYRNSTAIVEPLALSVPGCGELCPLERFLELYQHLTSVDWEQECKQQVYFYPWLWFVGASGAIFVAYGYTSQLFFIYMRAVGLPLGRC